MRYYKVVENITKPVTVDTATHNYGTTLANRNMYNPLLDIITNSSADYDFPLDIYFTLNNNIALHGNSYLENFPQPVGGYYDLSHLCTAQHRRSLPMKQNDLVKFVEDIDSNGIILFHEGFYLWEYIYEHARSKSFPECPARHESFFLFENKEDCRYYIETHGKFGGKICEVEIINTKNLFRGDMNIYDEIPNHYSFAETSAEADRYWGGKLSQKPIIEVLFQGTCELKPL